MPAQTKWVLVPAGCIAICNTARSIMIAVVRNVIAHAAQRSFDYSAERMDSSVKMLIRCTHTICLSCFDSSRHIQVILLHSMLVFATQGAVSLHARPSMSSIPSHQSLNSQRSVDSATAAAAGVKRRHNLEAVAATAMRTGDKIQVILS